MPEYVYKCERGCERFTRKFKITADSDRVLCTCGAPAKKVPAFGGFKIN